MAMPPELRPMHGRLAGREAGWATWSSLESSRSRCFLGYQSPGVCGGVSSPAADSGVWGRSWEHSWSGFVFLSETPL